MLILEPCDGCVHRCPVREVEWAPRCWETAVGGGLPVPFWGTAVAACRAWPAWVCSLAPLEEVADMRLSGMSDVFGSSGVRESTSTPGCVAARVHGGMHPSPRELGRPGARGRPLSRGAPVAALFCPLWMDISNDISFTGH